MAQSMPSLQSTSLQTNSIGNSIGDGVFCCSVLFYILGGPGVVCVVLGTDISGFFSVPGGPPGGRLSRENKNPSIVIFQSRYECLFF